MLIVKFGTKYLKLTYPVCRVWRITFFQVYRVEDQKLNQMTAYTVSPVRWDPNFQANRVENQKLNRTTAELPFG